MAFVLEDAVEIAAPAPRVWEVVSDLAAYRDWNPFVVDAHSSLVPGERIVMKVRVFPGITQPQREKIFSCEPGRGFSYGIALPLRCLTSRRSHEIVPTGESTARYVSHFAISGWLAPLVNVFTGRRLRAGFSNMTQAIKERAEALEAGATG